MLLRSRSPRTADPLFAAGPGDSGERGSAALEFIALGVILLVPLVYLVLALGTIQGQVLGVESAARHAARMMSAATGPDDANVRADAAIRSAIGEYGLDASAVQTDVRCAPAGAGCPSAGATVVVTVSTRVALPFVPPVFGLDRAGSVPIQASSAYKVSRTWTAG
ncbi:TadE family protein [Microbacterium capsulatum]|uniref:TadE family protein n=1 Tax=Microbacterium capsulatum TaxID=3041921 RepID=A0ABU0XIZ9_9MICO|nr:TadE family protein [Microbacterium sp. ASV81]MDQ4214110.1 TadE family protein [Microbacterium sp. ASV81]